MISGLPKIAPMAAMEPASIITVRAGLVGSRKANAPHALPMAMSGASGPRTAPKDSVPRAARTTETISRGPMFNASPWSGWCPPLPGSFSATYTIRAPVTRMATTIHAGVESYPSVSGSVVHRRWISSSSALMNADAARPASRPTTIPNSDSAAI